MSGIDPATEIPPLGLVTFRRQWRPPFIYSANDLEALMAAVPRLIPTPMRAATFQTMIGLLSSTGMRVGEVISLGRSDIDWSDGVLIVRASKFNKSREVPLDPTVVDALGSYAGVRDRCVREPRSSAFFVSRVGTPVFYSDFGFVFRRLVRDSGVGASSPVSPRIHGLRHSFAVHTLVRWYEAGEDVGALLPRLSTYMGHFDPTKGSQTVFARHRTGAVLRAGAWPCTAAAPSAAAARGPATVVTAGAVRVVVEWNP